MRVKEEAAFEIDEAGARGRVLYLLPSPLSESLSSVGLSHHPHPTERPSSDNSRILVILDWSDKKSAASLSAATAARQ